MSDNAASLRIPHEGYGEWLVDLKGEHDTLMEDESQ